MRHPLWILNSALFLLLVVFLVFMIFARVQIPSREEIEPTQIRIPAQRKISEVNIRKIYENDLFGTYQPTTEEIKEPNYIAPLPPPPMPHPVRVPPEPKPQFLEPLKITLKGIIILSNDDRKNRAIIADAKTGKEQSYKVGDSIEDAQLIKIFNNKILLLRANGQQEVLYLRPKDAKLDPAYAVISDWKDVIHKVADNAYAVHMKEFSFRIKNLAQVIDLLDLTTVYKHGKSVGCKIGKLAENSLGTELGLQSGDIILTINGTPSTDTPNRLAIYKQIIAMKPKDTIIVELTRNNMPQTITITLEEPEERKGLAGKELATPQQLKIMEERHKFAPTIKDIRAHERQMMLHNGRPTTRPLPAPIITGGSDDEE